MAAWLAVGLSLTACGGLRHIPGSASLRGWQPTADEIAWAARVHGVKTVISLRGPAKGRSYYDEAVAVCKKLGLAHHSLSWSARGTSDEKVDDFVELLLRCDHPVLLHCRSGHDRSSLGSAIYRSVVLGHSDADAGDELDFVPYGHVPMFGFEAMDEAWARFVDRKGKGEIRVLREMRERGQPDPSTGASGQR